MKRDKRIDGLRLKYRPREMMWNYGLKWMLEIVFMEAWKDASLIVYPLAMDFSFGTLKHYYLRHGLSKVWDRLMNYNLTLAAKMRGDDKETYEDLLTKQGQYDRQLDKEMEELEQDYSY